MRRASTAERRGEEEEEEEEKEQGGLGSEGGEGGREGGASRKRAGGRGRRGAASPGRWERRPIQSPAAAAAHPEEREREMWKGELFKAEELNLPHRSSVI